MAECKLNGVRENEIALGLYLSLINEGVGCPDLDVGYSVVNYAGIHCPNKEDKVCTKGTGDGVVEPEEVIEYALNNYEKYQKLIEGTLKSPLPWVLDDLDPTTTFDADIRRKIGHVIDELKKILNENGLKEDTEEYKERLAIGLFWLVTLPGKDVLENEETLKRYAKSTDMLPDVVETAKNLIELLRRMRTDLDANGLGSFWDYLIDHGGLRVGGDYSNEWSALDALKNQEGECTENSKILFAIFKMAKLEPVFIYDDLLKEDTKDPIRDSIIDMFRDPVEDTQFYLAHVCIGNMAQGVLRLMDPSMVNSGADYKLSHPMSLRQYLSFDYDNLGNQWVKKREKDKAITFYSYAIKIDPQSAMGYLNRGSSFFGAKDLNNAIDDYSEAIRIDPEFTMAYISRGLVWERKGEWDKAVADFSEAIRVDPNVTIICSAYNARGEVRETQGKPDDAMVDFSEAIRISPKFGRAYGNRALSFANKGKLADAINDLSMSFKLDSKGIDFFSSRLLGRLSHYLWTDKKMGPALGAFNKDTGLYPQQFVTDCILSFSLWKAEKYNEAKEKFQEAVKQTTFKKPPSATTKRFLKNILDLMPQDMQSDVEIRKALNALTQ